MPSTTKSASFSPQIQTTEKGKLLLFQKYYSRFLKSHIPAKTFASSRIFSIAFFFRKCLWYILWIDSPISVSYKYAPPYHVCFKVFVSHESITFFAVNFYLNQKIPYSLLFFSWKWLHVQWIKANVAIITPHSSGQTSSESPYYPDHTTLCSKRYETPPYDIYTRVKSGLETNGSQLATD